MSLPAIATELRVLISGLCDWRSCLLSKLVLLLGASYSFGPLDLIPDRTPIIGHFDEIGFLMAGFVGSRYLIPRQNEDRYLDLWTTRLKLSVRPGPWQRLQFLMRIVQADVSDFFLYQYRDVDAFLITGKNSGTHWLKFMLSCALAKQYRVPPPRRSSGSEADAIISHPRWPKRYVHVPRIGSSHTIPSIAFAWPWLARRFEFRPVVVLVRDIRAAMLSHYGKWQHEYQVSFAQYVRGDPSGQRYRADIWWYTHFFNRWGDLAAALPNQILVVRYEDLKENPEPWLRRIATHCRIDVNDDAIATALRFVSRDAMRALLDPTNTEIVIPPDDTGPRAFCTRHDMTFMRNTFVDYLRYDFGYPHLSSDDTEEAWRLMDDDRDGIDSTALNVYQQRWWGAASSTLKEYRILEVPDDNGIVTGRLEYVIKRDAAAASIGGFFLRRGGATHWAHLGGPTIREGLSSKRQSEVLDKLICSLPKNTSFGFIYDPHVSYVDAMREAFEKHGFERSKLLTFERHPTGEDVISGLGGRARNHIRAALARKFSIGTIDAKTFIQFYDSNLKALGKSSSAPLSVALTLIEEGLKRKQVHLYAARQKDSGELSGAIACFSDRIKFYYSMSTHTHYNRGDARRRQNEDAIKCLLVTAMYDAQRQGLIYSTEGTPVDGAVWLHAEVLALGKNPFHREVQTRLAPLRIVCDAAARRLPPSMTRFINARVGSVLEEH